MAKTKKSAPRRERSAGAPLFKLSPHFLGGLVVFILLAAVVGGLNMFFMESRFFDLHEIIINRDEGYALTDLQKKLGAIHKGRNVFSIDLTELAETVKKGFPHVKKVEVRRVMPDRIEIDLVTRMPVAYVEAGKGYVIDKDCIVLAGGMGAQGLIRVKGINYFLKSPLPGDKITAPQVSKAVILIQGLFEVDFTSRYKVDYVDVSDKNNMLLHVNGVVVKMGSEDFTAKINRLKQILEDPKIRADEINYIDLRFKEAVISPK